MKMFFKKVLLIIILFGLGYFISADQTNITVYNQDLALVRQVREVDTNPKNLPLKFVDVAARLIPTSVHLRSHTDENQFVVLEQNFEYDLVSADKILQKYIDYPIEIINEKGELIRGILLSKTGQSLVLKTDDAIKIIPWNENLTVDVKELPEGLITRPTLIWEVSGVSGKKMALEVSYLTQGINWQAEYVGILNENSVRLDLAAWVSLDNKCGATFENANLKLVAGDIHRAPQVRPTRRFMRGDVAELAQAAAPEFEEREFFEYHIYQLDRSTTIKDQQIKQISLFSPCDVACEKKFFYNFQNDPKKVEVKILFKNEKKSGLGKPLPAGTIRLYQKDKEGLEFIGEDRIEHTSVNEEVKLIVGKAFDLAAERKVVDHTKISQRSERQKIEIELRNNKENQNVDIIVEEWLYRPNWKIENSNFAYNKKSANLIEFEVPVKANNKTIITYTITYSW
jgi:hypothetical protein